MNFWEKYRKLILIILFFGFTISAGYLIFLYFFKPIVSPGGSGGQEPAATSSGTGFPTASTGTPAAGLPDGAEGLPDGQQLPVSEASDIAYGGLTKVKKLSDDPALSPTLSGNGLDIQYYNQNDGKFYKIDKNGEISQLSGKIFHDVEKITWADSKDMAILEYPDGANILYHFGKEQQSTLPKHWEDFDFSPESDRIVGKSIGLDPDNRWLLVSKPDGSQTRPLEALGEYEDTVYSSWSPNNQSVAMYTKGIDFDRQEVYFVGLNNENFKSMAIEGRGFQPKWSPRGDKLLYSVYSSDNDMKPDLWIVNAQGDKIGTERKKLNVETWANKCAYADSASVYCAVPENLPEGAGLFTELAKTTKDRLYKIDTRSGLKKLVAVPDGAYNMSDLIVSENGYNLFFTDETSQRIHTIKLK